MLDKLFLHLVQYADELKNSSCPSIECGVFKGLEGIRISHTNEPSLTMEYRTPSPIDFCHSCSSIGSEQLQEKGVEQLNPVDCLRYSSTFWCQELALDSPFSTHPLPGPDSSRFCEVEGNGSFAGSSTLESNEDSDPFGVAGSPHSRITSDGGAADDCALLPVPFDPFADPLFSDFPLPKAGTGLSRIELVGEAEDKGACSESPDPSTLLPCLEGSSIPKPTNVFVANFPPHWGKSDLWDLFEGIPVATVHVLPEKKVKSETPASGGTGFVNVIRSSDAKALLSMLDKKIWLIDGSALKFRLANSNPPSDPVNFHEPKNVRTIRRHQHKVIDRLRAEQTIGSQQIGACDRHQIVVYKNSTSGGKLNATLSVVHSSRQRNSYAGCSPSESVSRPHKPHRPLLEFLRSQLNRWNNYNSQCIVPSAMRASAPPMPLSVPAQHLAGPLPRPQDSPVMPPPKVTPCSSPFNNTIVPFSPVKEPSWRILEVPQYAYYLWSPETNQTILACQPPAPIGYSLGVLPSGQPSYSGAMCDYVDANKR